nr:hypothetical protein [Pseudoxanthomonas sp.]
MDTLAEIRTALDTASDRLARGLVRQPPQEFLDELWTHIYTGAPVDLQPYVWSRLMELGAGLMPTAGLGDRFQPPASHYRL